MILINNLLTFQAHINFLAKPAFFHLHNIAFHLPLLSPRHWISSPCLRNLFPSLLQFSLNWISSLKIPDRLQCISCHPHQTIFPHHPHILISSYNGLIHYKVILTSTSLNGLETILFILLLFLTTIFWCDVSCKEIPFRLT